jgi:nucleotide-binding universal stress UspA family protein
MDDPRDGAPVLVAVADPNHVDQLVRTAGDLARVTDGRVRVVSVVEKPFSSPFRVFTDETIAREFAADRRELLERATAVAPTDVDVDSDIIVAQTAARGLLRAVAVDEPVALVVGWQGRRRRSDAVLGTTVDALVERVACDLYVERIGREANGVDSVLVPVAGGPHVGVATAVAKAIAARNDARVHLFSVADGEQSVAAAEEFLREARDAVTAAPGPETPVETALREHGDVTEAIVEAATDHEVVVLGATRQGSFRRRLLGSIPQRVVDRTERTTIVARDGGAVDGSLGRRVGGLLRRR